MAIMYAPTIISIVAGDGYEGSIIPLRIIIPLMLIIGYEQIIVLQALTPMNKDRVVLSNSIVGAIVGLLLNILLVKSYGRIGSSMVWVVSEISVLLMAQMFVRRYISLPFPFKKYIQYITGSIPAFAICWLIQINMKEGLFSFIISGLLICSYFFLLYVFVLNNNHVQYLINLLSQKIHFNHS